MSLFEMRKSYALATLEEKDIDPDPMVQFKNWLAEALQGDLPDWVEVNAMVLSTSNGKGDVTSRVVLLKGLDDGKFWFYTNYLSDKAAQIESNPQVALCFLWQHIQRQVRIRGTISKATRDQSVRYFHSRPRDSQLGALVSHQSSRVENRETLETKLAELKKQYGKDDPIPCPENWGGYGVQPHSIEFWQGRESRLHDRLRYNRQDASWVIERLAP